MASCMAVGKMVSLAIPVLASIYSGSSSSKPLKKRSLREDESVDIDPKHAKWGTTRRPGLVVVSSADIFSTDTKDVETTTLAEPTLSSEVRTEKVDSNESSDCMVTEVADTGDEV
ncbi:hypothetical protein LIER_39780 [Lithospermum erythrorhizon]|uniref:Uncharacterized protein n=1 Tax=Lithospermum erythrorhizon TaxID=34254 RepID=A0AAV3QMQ3_LITER